MATRKQQRWDVGDVFLVRQRDGQWSAGQILDRMMPNVISCAFYDMRVAKPDALPLPLSIAGLIAVASVTRDGLDSGEWRVVGHAPIGVERRLWPNEPFRNIGWIGAKIFDAGIFEEFLEAFHGLVPWDNWKDPDYLDRLLISPDKKPANLVYKSH
jgi:hypothetical protein